MIITGNYTLQANPNWKQLQLQEIYLECDTALAAVNITLPEIASMGGFFNVKIYVSDFANNASVNNINVVVSGSDTIDASPSITINTNGGSAVIAITSPTQWICLESNAGGGGSGTVTSVNLSSNGTALTISGNPITTAGTIAVDFNGANTDYVDGTGALRVFPTVLVTVTKAALDALILSNSLVVGSFYRVLGVDVPLYGGTDIIVQAVSSNEISEDGTGLFYNPKYLTYGIYDPYVVVDVTTTTGEFTFNETFTSNNGTTGTIFGTCVSGQRAFLLTSNLTGLTSSISITGDTSGQTANILIYSVPPYGINSKVIWGGLVWENTSNDLGQIVDIYNLSPADWQVITYNTTDYNYVADAIKYDYVNDLITYRCEADADNSVLATIVDNLSFSFVTGYAVNAIKAFQWGRQLDLITFTGNNGNKVENSYFECINFNTQQTLWNNITQNSVLYGITTISGGSFNGNNFKNNVQVGGLTLIDSSDFKANNISDGSNITATTLQNSNFMDNIFNFGSITGLFFSNSDFRTNLFDNSFINGLFCNDSYFNSNNLSYANVSTNSLKNNSSITQNVLINSQIGTNTLVNTQILYNNLEGSTINVNTFASTTVYYNKLKSGLLTTNITSGGGSSIQSNLILSNSSISTNTLVASNIDFNTLETGCDIINNVFDKATLSANNLYLDSKVISNNFEQVTINENILSIGSTINNCSKTGSSNAILNNNTLNTFSYIEFVCIDASQIVSNSLSNYSFISENVGGQIIILQNNTIVNYSRIKDNNYSGGLVANNELYLSSYIDANTLNGGFINGCVLTSNSNISYNTIGASSSIGSRTTLDSSSILSFTIGANTTLGNYTLQKSTLTGWNLTAVSGLSPTCIFINNQVLSLLVAFPTSGTYIGMLEFANNAAALAGGLAATGLYRVTGTGTVQIVI